MKKKQWKKTGALLACAVLFGQNLAPVVYGAELPNVQEQQFKKTQFFATTGSKATVTNVSEFKNAIDNPAVSEIEVIGEIDLDRTPDSTGRTIPLLIPSEKKIIGEAGGTLTFPGSMQLGADVTFQNIDLKFVSDKLGDTGVIDRYIYLNGHHLTLDNVETIDEQGAGGSVEGFGSANKTPIVLGGRTYHNTTTGNEAKLTVRNSTGKTIFAAIHMGKVAMTYTEGSMITYNDIPYTDHTSLELDAQTKVTGLLTTDGTSSSTITLSGMGIQNYKNLIGGDNSTLIIDGGELDNVQVVDFKNIQLQNGAILKPKIESTFENISVSTGTILDFVYYSSSSFSRTIPIVGNFSGGGILKLNPDLAKPLQIDGLVIGITTLDTSDGQPFQRNKPYIQAGIGNEFQLDAKHSSDALHFENFEWMIVEKNNGGNTGGSTGGDSGNTGGSTGGNSGSTGGNTGGDSGSTGGNTGGDSGNTGGSTGGDSGNTGGSTGGNSGSTGGNTGGDSGSTGGSTGGDSGNTGGSTGGDSGNTGGNTGGDSGNTGGSTGGDSGNTGGNTGGDSGNTGGSTGGDSGNTGGSTGGDSGNTGGSTGGNGGNTGGNTGTTGGNTGNTGTTGGNTGNTGTTGGNTGNTGTTGGNTETTVTVDNKGNATVSNELAQTLIESAKKEANQNGTKQLEVSLPVSAQKDQTTLNVTLKPETLDQFVQAGVERFEITTDHSIQASFDSSTLQQLSQNASNRDLVLRVEPQKQLSKEAKTAISSRPVYDVTMVYQENGKETPITKFKEGKIMLKLPYTLAKGENKTKVSAVYVNDQGKVSWLKDSYYDSKEKAVILESNHLSVYGIGYEKLTKPKVMKTNAKVAEGVKVSWSRVSGTSGYEIYRGNRSNGSYKLVNTCNNRTVTYVDKDVDPNRSYYYKVRGYEVINGKKVYGAYSTLSKATVPSQKTTK